MRGTRTWCSYCHKPAAKNYNVCSAHYVLSFQNSSVPVKAWFWA